MYMHFYTVQLGACSCGKPATHEVFGPHNASYGKYCKADAIKKEKELTKYWNDQSEQAKKAQYSDTRHDK